MTNSKHILITGSNGQLGNECRVLSLNYPQYTYTFVSRDELPIDDFDAVKKIFSCTQFDYCINCAAYTAVDQAEVEQSLAFKMNAEAVENLAGLCKQYSVQFIHISTDYVFDGENALGYNELDATSPLNVYGASKLAGEKAALAINPSSIIIRTSWVYSSFGKNFVKTMMRLMREKEQISVVADQIGRPTYAADLADAIFNIISKHNQIIPGIYHFANEGIISWFEFAQEIKLIRANNCQIMPIKSIEYPVPAKRPHYSILSTNKIESTFGIHMSHWKDSLRRCMQLIQ